MKDFNFRSLKEGDINQIVELFKGFGESNAENVDFNELIVNPKYHCVVIENKDKVIGFGALLRYIVPSKGEVARIEDIIIDSNFRGNGLGKAMMQELISIASEENIHQIDLTSKRIRTSARKLYESLGFIIRESDIFRLKL